MKVYHFYNGTGGGVLSVIKNLLQFSGDLNIEQHVIHVVNSDIVSKYQIEPIKGAQSQQLHYYSSSHNFYYTCKQMAKLLPDAKAIIIAHDWIELGMASNLGLPNPLIHILHGDFDYYYELAKSHSHAIDAYICISPKIFQSIIKKIPSRIEDAFYLKFPVPYIEVKTKLNDTLHLLYYVRDLKDDRKQFSTIIEIARQLIGDKSNYFFTIAGGGITKKEFFESWPSEMSERVDYIGLRTNEEMIALLRTQDVFLLPSLAEGFPVSLVESMKAGLIPMVSYWDGAADELIIPGISGYYFQTRAVGDYVSCIRNLHTDRKLLNQISENCIKQATSLFDPVENTNIFEEVYKIVYAKKRKSKAPLKIYGSRLDMPWIPNWTTKLIRSFL